jgi:hypothetical protein
VGACAAACIIGGTPVLAGQQNPSGGTCEGCDPAQSMTSWSKLDDGAYCGAGEVCIAGSCVQGCSEGAKGYPVGTTEPSNPCRTCTESSSGSDWTATVATGTVCGAGEVCFEGSCQSGCYVAGTFYSANTPNPGNSCQLCTPSSSPTAWSPESDGNDCMATPSTGGACCAGACADTRQDVNNCGACGHACPVAGGSVCTGGLCATTVVSAGGSSIALDATNVYWTDANAGTVMKAPLAGGTPAMISTGQSQPDGLVVDTTNAYWISGTYSIASAPLGGGGPTTPLVSLPITNYVYPSSIAVAGGSLYYTTASAVMSTYTIAKLPATGGKATQLTSGNYNAGGIHVTATDIYWSTQKGIFQLPLAGVTPTTLWSGFPSGFAVDPTSLYFTASTFVEKAPLAGGAATTLFSGTPSIDAPGGLLVDSSNLYFVDGSGAGTAVRILALPLGGGTPTTLAAGQTLAGFALSATDVYWITSSAILRVPK